jgi:hypothetical protein
MNADEQRFPTEIFIPNILYLVYTLHLDFFQSPKRLLPLRPNLHQFMFYQALLAL